MDSFFDKINKRTQRNIHLSNPGKTAKIISRDSNGTYTCETLDGLTIHNVHNQTQVKWNADQWVALEYLGGDWMIVGLSSHRGGD